MDENISHAIALMGASMLFLVAFSLSVIFYDGLADRAEEFFEVTTATARREDATSVISNRNDIKRKITFQEVYMAILSLPAYVSGDGNLSNSKIIIEDPLGIAQGTYIATFDLENNISKVTLLDAPYPFPSEKSYLVGKIDSGNPLHAGLKDLRVMITDFCTLALGVNGTSGSTSNEILNNRESIIKDTTFSIRYSGDAIVYTRN